MIEITSKKNVNTILVQIRDDFSFSSFFVMKKEAMKLAKDLRRTAEEIDGYLKEDSDERS